MSRPLEGGAKGVFARFADVVLGHVTREYPNHLSHSLAGLQDIGAPRPLLGYDERLAHPGLAQRGAH